MVSDNIIAPQEELLRREQEGLYRFNDEEILEEVEELETVEQKVIGDTSNIFFAGKIICNMDNY